MGEFHTNSAENFFSLFKRSVRGTYSHISEKHLHRYLSSTSAIRTASSSVLTTRAARIAHCAVSSARGSPIGGLVGPDDKQMTRQLRRNYRRWRRRRLESKE